MDNATPSTSKADLENTEEASAGVMRGSFKCYICSLEENYQYKGNSPPFAKHVIMSEDCYLLEDPFSPPGKGEYLILGTDCSVCHSPVCKATECSFFYEKTYCINCIKQKVNKFPVAVQSKISKILKY